jgi:hypothetical protein
MDVQATAEAPPLPSIAFSAPAPPPPPPPAPTGISAAGSGSSSGAAVDSAPARAALPDLAPGSLPLSGSDSASLGESVAKMFNTAADNVSVSFQVAEGSNDVVVVFTDKTSGKKIIQFPSETLIALAQFFNKLAGAVLDKKA